VSETQGMTKSATLYAEAREAWSQFAVAEDVFDAAMAARGNVGDAAEVYLACACAAGVAIAIRCFEDKYFRCIPAVVGRLGLSASDADEIAQTLRQRLFVGTDGVPKVTEYAGQGQLAGLVQVAATRIGLNLRRGRERIADEPAPDAPSEANDAAYAKAEYRAHVRRALEDAAAALPARDRTILRMHLVERASIDDIAAVYRVHRATAARWVTAAREALIRESRDRFLTLAKLEDDDTPGLASFVESQLTLSLDRILA
jgi:RNA polymerase sigma-70 factor, ECF subfamily